MVCQLGRGGRGHTHAIDHAAGVEVSEMSVGYALCCRMATFELRDSQRTVVSIQRSVIMPAQHAQRDKVSWCGIAWAAYITSCSCANAGIATEPLYVEFETED
jgi:hypothetical protein